MTGARKGTARRRAKKHRQAKAVEDAQKAIVRIRDGRCRFPLCGCWRLNMPLHVSHAKHKGMGGNPTGDRSLSSLMLLLCAGRHRELRVSIDQGALRWEGLTEAGADGPIAWYVQVMSLPMDLWLTLNWEAPEDGWYLLAREVAPGTLEPLTDRQSRALSVLARMMCR